MQDHGYCGFGPAEEVVAEVAASRHLVHWGLMTAERSCSLEQRLEHHGCPYDKVLQHTSAVAAGPEQHAELYPSCFAMLCPREGYRDCQQCTGGHSA